MPHDADRMNEDDDATGDGAVPPRQQRSAIIDELLSLTPPDDGFDNDVAGGAPGRRRIRLGEIVADLLGGAIDARGGGRRDARRPTLRESLGCDDLPSSAASGLASCLARLMSSRGWSLDDDGIDDDDADVGGGVATSSVSPLSMDSALLYAELIGTEGAWGAGMIDAGGMIAIRSVVRGWCATCCSRVAVATGRGGRGRGRPPKRKRSKAVAATTTKNGRTAGGGGGLPPSRRSARIGEISTDGGGEYDDDDGGNDDDVNDNDVANEDDHNDGGRAHCGVIAMGPRLAAALGRASSHHADYVNWPEDAREFYVEAACAALGMMSALSSRGCRAGFDHDDDDDGDFAVACREAASWLERALRSTVLPPPSPAPRDDTSPPDGPTPSSARSRERSASGPRNGRRRDVGGRGGGAPRSTGRAPPGEERSREAGIHLLRGLLPLFHLRTEVPNGQAGKLAALEAASALLVGVVASISEDVVVVVAAIDDPGGRTPRVAVGAGDSATPKRGGRKSVGFSHTPGGGREFTSPSPNAAATMMMMRRRPRTPS